MEDPLGNETTLTFDKAHCGRFVKLWRKEGFLTICEIEIYSENTGKLSISCSKASVGKY